MLLKIIGSHVEDQDMTARRSRLVVDDGPDPDHASGGTIAGVFKVEHIRKRTVDNSMAGNFAFRD